MNRPFMTRRATEYDVQKRADAHLEALEDGSEYARLAFAEYLAEEGALGDVPDLGLDMTVRHLATLKLTLPNGRAAAKAWARELAEEQIEGADWTVPA